MSLIGGQAATSQIISLHEHLYCQSYNKLCFKWKTGKYQSLQMRNKKQETLLVEHVNQGLH